jgi:hypothetical protein
MNIRNNYFFEAGGLEFESEIVDIVSSFAKREWGIGAVKFSTVLQDRYEGTDIFILGVPIDVTLAFSRKNKTRRLGELMLDGVTVDFGVRFGNHKANFKTPVLVIGAGTAIGITKNNMWVALETIKANVQEILNTGMDGYFLATEV